MDLGTVCSDPSINGYPCAREAMGFVYDGAHNQFVMFGGCCDSSGNDLSDTWTWDQTNGWVSYTPTHIPCSRHSTRLAYDAGTSDQYVVMFGGDFSNGTHRQGAPPD